MTQPTQTQTTIRSFEGNDAPLPPPGYLAATSRGITRYIPRDDPQPRRQPLQVDILPPAHQVDTPMPVRTVATLTGDYKNRAEGFRIAMLPVAIVAGILAVVAAVGLFSVPFLSWTALMWFFTLFCVTWLGGFVLHQWVSPDGTALTMVLLHYKLLRAEQAARLNRMATWEEYDDAD